MIEISSCNVLVYRHGGEFSPFVGARIVAGIMRFIADGIMKCLDAPGNIIGRGPVGMLNKVCKGQPLDSCKKDEKCIGVFYEVW